MNRKRTKKSRGHPRESEDDKDFLLEIGCEELPADYLPGALDWDEKYNGLLFSAKPAFDVEGIRCGELSTYGTPRRLVLHVRDMVPTVKKEDKGPPVQVAYDAKGNPTVAAQAFAQRNGVKVTDLEQRDTPKGRVVYAVRDVPVEEILAASIPTIIQRIGFPKTMRWDDSAVRFARPIRWIVCLYGKEVVPCSYGHLKAGRETYLTRRSGSKSVKIASADRYLDLMVKAGIHLEEGLKVEAGKEEYKDAFKEPRTPKKRTMLLELLQQSARSLGGRLADTASPEFEWLLNTVDFLAENPVVQTGSFRTEYLELPAEVLETAMAKHLKLFSVRSADGKKLLPKFLTVLEGKPGRPAKAMANYERVLTARFTDARFFYREDARTPLEAKISQLSKVVFHEKLGSVGDRIPRMERLMRAAVQQLEAPDSVRRWACEAARLAKADLVTQMVREFPSLQGVMGGQYARAERRPGELAQAIADQYKPRTAGDPAPSTLLGALLSLVDRLDTLIGYFGAGLKPTGSLDPYALRRQAQGLVRILLTPPAGFSFIGLSIDRLSDESIQSWGPRLTLDPKTLKRELRGFLRERFEWLVTRPTAVGDRELVAAVLAVDDDDLAGARERLEILREYWSGSRDGKRQVLEWAAKVAERTSRIVKSVRGMDLSAAVDATALKEPAEKELWAAWSKVGPQIREQLKGRRFQEATQTYSTLYPTVHTFFEKVFVMDENIDLRRNRLALMKEIYQSLSGGFADLSKLPLAGVE